MTSDGRRDWNEDAAVIVSGLVIRQPCVVAVLAGRGRHRAGLQQPRSVVPGSPRREETLPSKVSGKRVRVRVRGQRKEKERKRRPVT